jgi:hypothetical protein
MGMTEAQRARDDVDLTNCDREPIHIPGAILPHGAMLVLECETLRVLQAAGDTMGLLGRPITDLLDRPVDTLFSRDQINRLRVLCTETDLGKPRHLLDPILRAIVDRPLDASAHCVAGALVIEFEAAEMSDPFVADPLAAVQVMVEGFGERAARRPVRPGDDLPLHGRWFGLGHRRRPDARTRALPRPPLPRRRHPPAGPRAVSEKLAAADHPGGL